MNKLRSLMCIDNVISSSHFKQLELLLSKTIKQSTERANS